MIDIDGETGEARFIVGGGIQIVIGAICIARAVTVKVVELDAQNMSGDHNIPFSEARIIGGGRAELREQRDIIGRQSTGKCTDREIEDIVFLALPGTFI